MIDLHCHIVPAIDDGPPTWEDAAAMLHEASDSAGGRISLVATPHLALRAVSGGRGYRDRRIDAFASLARAEIPYLRIGFGAEIALDSVPTRRQASAMPAYPGSDWVLVELPQRLSWTMSVLRLWALSRWAPRILLAHPERYGWCRARPGRLSTLGRLGVRVQVCGRSLEKGGAAVRDTALGLIGDGLCSIFASDCHHPGDRMLASFEEVIRAGSGTSAWDALCRVNPALILENEALPAR